MSVRILNGDVFDMLRIIPDGSVNCCVTSPPYWGLRSYLPDDHPDKPREIGMEPTLGEHLEVLLRVFDEVRRVLTKDGVCWLNYGDCYATTPNGRSAADTKTAGNDDRTFRDKPFSTIGPVLGHSVADGARNQNGKHSYRSQNNARPVAGGYLKPKDLCLIPARLSIALQDAGWWVRSKVIWNKPNPMPDSSGRYRPSACYEEVLFLAKSADHYYDYGAVMEPISEASVARLGQPTLEQQEGSARANAGRKTNGKMKAVKFGGNKGGGDFGAASRTFSGNEWEPKTDMRLMRNVWTIPTAAFTEAHYATFPPALVEPCIKAGCPSGGLVLDPFGGAGTVGMVADRLGRDAILIELNPESVEIAERRLNSDAGMFGQIKSETPNAAHPLDLPPFLRRLP